MRDVGKLKKKEQQKGEKWLCKIVVEEAVVYILITSLGTLQLGEGFIVVWYEDRRLRTL